MGQGGAAMELLPYSAQVPGSILTTEFVRSPCDCGFHEAGDDLGWNPPSDFVQPGIRN